MLHGRIPSLTVLPPVGFRKSSPQASNWILASAGAQPKVPVIAIPLSRSTSWEGQKQPLAAVVGTVWSCRESSTTWIACCAWHPAAEDLGKLTRPARSCCRLRAAGSAWTVPSFQCTRRFPLFLRRSFRSDVFTKEQERGEGKHHESKYQGRATSRAADGPGAAAPTAGSLPPGRPPP